MLRVIKRKEMQGPSIAWHCLSSSVCCLFWCYILQAVLLRRASNGWDLPVVILALEWEWGILYTQLPQTRILPTSILLSAIMGHSHRTRHPVCMCWKIRRWRIHLADAVDRPCCIVVRGKSSGEVQLRSSEPWRGTRKPWLSSIESKMDSPLCSAASRIDDRISGTVS